MKYLAAELDEIDGVNAVMQAVRDNAVYEIADQSSPVIPLNSLEGFTEEAGAFEIWLPISKEDPIHISVDYGNEFHTEGLKGTAKFTFIGTIAARDLCVPQFISLDEIDRKHMKRLNKLFDKHTGEYGCVLKAGVEYVKIGDTQEIFTTAELAVIENETEFKELRGKNPSSFFNA